MNADKLRSLQIRPEEKKRPQRPLWVILILVALAVAAAVYFAWPRASDQRRIINTGAHPTTNNDAASSRTNPSAPPSLDVSGTGPSLTVNGYLINRERIEISPRFLGLVTWIGVKKGDVVTNGQVVVLLDETEYRARYAQAAGQLANTKAIAAKNAFAYDRIHRLTQTGIESKQVEDDTRLLVEADKAAVEAAEGSLALAKTYLDWCTIRSPINGVVLEKLVNANELVMPQSFGGGRGPRTALMAVADPIDLQVEIDVNEADLSKISPGQPCRVSPEAYPERRYDGIVAEIAPEADRAKGTLQIKVQILKPDAFLTPQLSAKVEFLK